MKKSFLAILIIGLLFTPKAQADEIFNNTDLPSISFYELQNYQNTAKGDQNDCDKGFHLFEVESYGHHNCGQTYGYRVTFGNDKQTILHTIKTEIRSGNSVIEKRGRSYKSHVRMRRAKIGGENIQGDHYPITLHRDRPERYNYNFKKRNAQLGQALYLDRNSGDDPTDNEHSTKIY